MKKLLFSLIFLCKIIAQNLGQSVEVTTEKPYLLNGLEYGYEIRNEQKKDIKKEEYSRFELNVYVANKSGCTKVLLPEKKFIGIDYQDVIAEFDCINATGKRLSAKSGKVRARVFYTPYSYTYKGTDGKDLNRNVQVKVGNVLRNGETVYERFTVILPLGEQPKLRVRALDITEF
jgi:hypothetical protein